MKPVLLLLGGVLAGVAVGLSQANSNQVPAENAEAELVRLERQLPEAVLRGDAALVERYTADDFLGFGVGGEELRKADVLARLGAPGVELESLHHEDIRVRVFGEAAVATAVTLLRAGAQGQDVSGRFRYLRVWVRRDGRWQAVAAQSTRLPD